MVWKQGYEKNVLITGGTSGLGLELVRLFLSEGYTILTTGRQKISIPGSEGRFRLYNADFTSLGEVAAATKKICSDRQVSLIINNAGILSPPAYTETTDGFESTFQVNFLAHLLIDEIILNSIKTGPSPAIVSVTSPVYRFAELNFANISDTADYQPIHSYSASKLLLAMMCEFLSMRHSEPDLHCFGFNPGTFRSGIYRTQKGWFRNMYRIAAPFMRNPLRVAKVLLDLSLQDGIESGAIYDISKIKSSLPAVNRSQADQFIHRCYELIDPFMR